MKSNTEKMLTGYADKNPARFHMPGHKGNESLFSAYNIACDITELSFSDNLYTPENNGMISELEQGLAECFFPDNWDRIYTKISCGGATLLIQTAFLLLLRNKKKLSNTASKYCIICERACHISAVNVLALLDIEPIWIYRTEKSCLTSQIETAVERLYCSHDIIPACPHDITLDCPYNVILGVFVTSPDYYGEMQDIAAIKSACEKYSLPLCVDNSHGSHLAFHSGEPIHPILLGADLCIDSIHKTLPSPTGTALFHVKKNFCGKRDIESALRLFASTSPPFPLLSAVSAMRLYLCGSGRDKHRELLFKINELKSDGRISFFIKSFPLSDPYRIVLNIKSKGQNLYDHFFSGGLTAEFCDENSVILIPSIENRDEDFVLLKKSFLQFIEKNESKPCTGKADIISPLSVKKITLREAVLCAAKEVATEFISENISSGKEIICAQAIYRYPPGVPLILPGEVFTRANIDIIKKTRQTVFITDKDI